MESPTVIPVPDLDGALSFFIDQLGFRMHRIWPADDPRVAQLIGHDVCIELRIDGEPSPIPETLPVWVPSVEISRIADATWGLGRAGMRYRDLLPSRQGGHFIASHIQIPGTGPVPDWVHFHEVALQMIFCYRGRVSVVYEDQGPPFEMVAGDCVLQPPTIRHRVLESADDLEVIEIGGPACHVTGADHVLHLPNPTRDPERRFAGQRFVRSVAADAQWERHGMVQIRDLGIAAATDGLASVSILKGASDTIDLEHRGGLLFLFVLRGWLRVGEVLLETGDSIALAEGSSVLFSGEILRVSTVPYTPA